MEVNGEYVMASSTVGGGRYGRAPPLEVCQFPLAYSLMIARGRESCTRGSGGGGGGGVGCTSRTGLSSEAKGSLWW